MITWLKLYLSGFSTGKLFFLLLFMLYSLQRSHNAQPTLQEWKLCSTSFRVECINKLSGTFLHWRFFSSSPLIYSIIYLYQYGLRYLFYTLDYNSLLLYLFFLLTVFQFCPLGALSVGSCAPLIYSSHCGFWFWGWLCFLFSTFLLSRGCLIFDGMF